MPTGSPLPSFDVPKDDLWGFLFERKDKPFPDDKGKISLYVSRLRATHRLIRPLAQSSS